MPLRQNSVAFPSRSTERHYSVREIAELWGLSDTTVVRMFRQEPGVLGVNNSRRKFAGNHTTLRIPESVMDRVHRKLEVA